jgi:diguanylate cyclase (GGDEF)-like protein
MGWRSTASIDAMNTALQAPNRASGYADCLEAIRARIAAREAKLYGIAVLVVYAHRLEHASAGRMLDELRNLLSQVSRAGDYFARLGERKFVFVLSNLRNEGHALLTANKILRAGSETASTGDHHASVRLSVGVAMFPAHGRAPEALMQCAETALLESWKTQQPTVVYAEHKAEELAAGWDLETQLSGALEQGDLVLAYQPKLSLPKLEIAGCEALMRWNRPDAGNVPPEIFIDLAEMTGQIDPLTRFAIDRAFRQLREWPKALGSIGVAINVTPSIVCNPELVDALQEAAGRCAVGLDRLTLEVTENALMVDRERSHNVLARLRELGVRVSIDDFGTGYSSLAYLSKLPVDTLKIDRGFVRGMTEKSEDTSIISIIISLAQALRLKTVAEGVESEQQAQLLRLLRCDQAQGYLFGPPVAAERIEALLKAV